MSVSKPHTTDDSCVSNVETITEHQQKTCNKQEKKHTKEGKH